MRFRHPLIRSAAYYAALAAARRGAHQALAAVAIRRLIQTGGPGTWPEAAAGPDEQVAAELAVRDPGAWLVAAAPPSWSGPPR